MSKNHTPGPWTVRIAKTSVGLVRWHIAGVDADSFAPIAINSGSFDLFRSRETEESNARLIAAAPDLLEALAVLTELVSFQICDDGHPAIINARAAIAKATGEAASTPTIKKRGTQN